MVLLISGYSPLMLAGHAALALKSFRYLYLSHPIVTRALEHARMYVIMRFSH